MSIVKTLGIVLFVVVLALLYSSSNTLPLFTKSQDVNFKKVELSKLIPIGSNSWIINGVSQDEIVVSDKGIHNWVSTDDIIRTYVRTGLGELTVGLKMKSPSGISRIKVTVGDTSKEIEVSGEDYRIHDVGKFVVPHGYNYIEIQGLEKSGAYIGDITDLVLGGAAVNLGVTYVPISNHYFGRRGPSVHMSYDEPKGKAIQWFYNEITVPVGEDKIGSFFMANGHAQGYFGMQVNSVRERRVLFSIWSPFDTNDPNQVPENYKVTSIGSGEGVTVQDFGNEGSGKQSFKSVAWEAGITYKFLLKGEPSVISGSTDYTAYFFDPKIGDWQLIASLRRPQTSTYLTRLHSFLENFVPSKGFESRQVEFGNQWVYTTEGDWLEMTKGKFTADATATQGDRLDFEGGVNGNQFFLKNCGFFNANIQPNSFFTRVASGNEPNVDFAALEELKRP